MSNNVVSLNPLLAHSPAIHGNEPRQEIIAILKQYLAEAERGELRGIAIAGVSGSGTLSTRLDGDCSANQMFCASELLHMAVKDVWLVSMEATAQMVAVPEGEDDGA